MWNLLDRQEIMKWKLGLCSGLGGFRVWGFRSVYNNFILLIAKVLHDLSKL